MEVPTYVLYLLLLWRHKNFIQTLSFFSPEKMVKIHFSPPSTEKDYSI